MAGSSPQGYRRPSVDRAANSHCASVGSCLPAQAANASASRKLTRPTGTVSGSVRTFSSDNHFPAGWPWWWLSRAEEEAKLAPVRDLVLIDVVGRQPNLVRRSLRNLSVIGSHRECVTRHEDHQRTVAITHDDQRPARLVHTGVEVGLEAGRKRPGRERGPRLVLRRACQCLGGIGRQEEGGLALRGLRFNRRDRDDCRRGRRTGRGCDRFGLRDDDGPVGEQRQVLTGSVRAAAWASMRRRSSLVCRDHALQHGDCMVRPSALGRFIRAVVHEAGFLIERRPRLRCAHRQRRVVRGHIDRTGVIEKGAIADPAEKDRTLQLTLRSPTWPCAAFHTCPAPASPRSVPS